MRRLLLALLLLLAGVVALPSASAVPAPEGYAYTDSWFASYDGTQLHAGVFLPADSRPGERHPVLLVSTPYTAPGGGATGGAQLDDGPVIRFPELFEHPAFVRGRYAYVQVDVRGFGGSGGCFGYYLEPEKQDVKVAVEWAATQRWSTGKVGTWGKSYDAAQQVLALAARPKGLAAQVIQAPGLSAYTALWMNGVHYATGRYATTGVYTADDLMPPQNAGSVASPEYAAAAASAATVDPTCRTDAVVRMNTEGDRAGEFWKGKEPYLGARGSTIPTFWSHGFFDANTKPVHLDVWSALKGPKQAWFGQYTHLRGHEQGVGREGFNDEAFRFLDRYVRGVRTASDPAVTVQSGNGDGRWRAEKAWPPADGRRWALPLRPGSYVDEPGNNGDGSSAGLGHWTATRPLPYAAHLAGEVRLTATVSTVAPGAQVVAHVYDVDADGVATLVTRGAAVARATGAQEVAYALYPQDWVFEKGHRIALHLSAADDAWFSPGVTQTEVEVTGGTASFPLLAQRRTRFLAGDESDGTLNDSPFPVDAATLEEATVAALPPRQKG